MWLTPFRHIPIGGAAIVQLRLTNKRGIPIEPFEVNRNLGRVVLRSEGVTIGAGRIEFMETLLIEQALSCPFSYNTSIWKR